jgi:glutaconate CoA-transferase subunit B
MNSEKVSSTEMMAISAGRLIMNGDIVFAGTGISMLAATVAKKIYAPRSVIFFETGGIDPSLDELPLAVADPRVMSKTAVNAGLLEAFSIVTHKKLKTIALLGAAQIDMYGNLNSTCLGNYSTPRVRFPGSGGACDAASLAWSTIIFMQHEARRFVRRLDYFTSPGWLTGWHSRRKAGYERGGPLAVVTDMAVMKFHDITKQMYLAEMYPGVTPEMVRAATGFDLDVSMAGAAQTPSESEISILRNQVDPQRLILR